MAILKLSHLVENNTLAFRFLFYFYFFSLTRKTIKNITKMILIPCWQVEGVIQLSSFHGRLQNPASVIILELEHICFFNDFRCSFSSFHRLLTLLAWMLFSLNLTCGVMVLRPISQLTSQSASLLLFLALNSSGKLWSFLRCFITGESTANVHLCVASETA